MTRLAIRKALAPHVPACSAGEDTLDALVPVVAALLDAERPRCDCGGAVTVCADCAVADYQAQHPDCTTCCPAPPEDERVEPKEAR